jgi:hypothetical protein
VGPWPWSTSTSATVATQKRPKSCSTQCTSTCTQTCSPLVVAVTITLPVISFGANVFLPGTARPKYDGKGYTVAMDNLEALADGGDSDGAEAFVYWVAQHRTHKGEDFIPSPPWDGAAPDKRQAAYLAKVLTNHCNELAAMGPDTGRNVALYTAGLKCGSYVAGAGMDEATVIKALTVAADTCGLTRDDGANSIAASIRSGLLNGRRRPRAVPRPPDAPPPGVGLTIEEVSVSHEAAGAVQSHIDGVRQRFPRLDLGSSPRSWCVRRSPHDPVG